MSQTIFVSLKKCKKTYFGFVYINWISKILHKLLIWKLHKFLFGNINEQQLIHLGYVQFSF